VILIHTVLNIGVVEEVARAVKSCLCNAHCVSFVLSLSVTMLL
jgi:hypothetical protein